MLSTINLTHFGVVTSKIVSHLVQMMIGHHFKGKPSHHQNTLIVIQQYAFDNIVFILRPKEVYNANAYTNKALSF